MISCIGRTVLLRKSVSCQTVGLVDCGKQLKLTPNLRHTSYNLRRAFSRLQNHELVAGAYLVGTFCQIDDANGSSWLLVQERRLTQHVASRKYRARGWIESSREPRVDDAGSASDSMLLLGSPVFRGKVVKVGNGEQQRTFLCNKESNLFVMQSSCRVSLGPPRESREAGRFATRPAQEADELGCNLLCASSKARRREYGEVAMRWSSALMRVGAAVMVCTIPFDTGLARPRGVCTRNIAIVCAVSRTGELTTYMNANCARAVGARRIVHPGQCRGKAGCKGMAWCLPRNTFVPSE